MQFTSFCSSFADFSYIFHRTALDRAYLLSTMFTGVHHVSAVIETWCTLISYWIQFAWNSDRRLNQLSRSKLIWVGINLNSLRLVCMTRYQCQNYMFVLTFWIYTGIKMSVVTLMGWHVEFKRDIVLELRCSSWHYDVDMHFIYEQNNRLLKNLNGCLNIMMLVLTLWGSYV